MTIDLGGRHVPTVFSVMNAAGNVGATLFPAVIPYLLGDAAGGAASWDGVLYAFAGLHVVAAICWLCLNPNRPIAPANE